MVSTGEFGRRYRDSDFRTHADSKFQPLLSLMEAFAREIGAEIPLDYKNEQDPTNLTLVWQDGEMNSNIRVIAAMKGEELCVAVWANVYRIEKPSRQTHAVRYEKGSFEDNSYIVPPEPIGFRTALTKAYQDANSIRREDLSGPYQLRR